jgi:hypothetical protein
MELAGVPLGEDLLGGLGEHLLGALGEHLREAREHPWASRCNLGQRTIGEHLLGG